MSEVWTCPNCLNDFNYKIENNHVVITTSQLIGVLNDCCDVELREEFGGYEFWELL